MKRVEWILGHLLMLWDIVTLLAPLLAILGIGGVIYLLN
jgi:hypothetical protein